jgi:hypothetical protein
MGRTDHITDHITAHFAQQVGIFSVAAMLIPPANISPNCIK